MTHPLFDEIAKFEQWANAYSAIPQEERVGEWECDYDVLSAQGSWSSIYKHFDDFIMHSEPLSWTDSVISKLLYIIARDNECEILAREVTRFEKGFIILAKKSLEMGPRDAKWQLAVRLNLLADKKLAFALLEAFVKDPEEYVNRRALMKLAEMGWEKTEDYCRMVWERKNYGEVQEYQRMAVLYSLRCVKSPLLSEYIRLAKEDGRKHLVLNAEKIEMEM
ncbi:MAG TPA: hypothetical protein VFJ43_07940 [Bacteroidia bacterium]|nr:hypothetical protein [Bacteroidia bacterium]